MFDIRWIRENPDQFDAALAMRGLEPQAAGLIALDEKRRAHVAKLQEAQERRNAASKEIGKAKSSGDEECAQALIAEIADLKGFVQDGKEEERRLTAALETAMSEIPNLPHEDVPVGVDESDNVLVHKVGEPRQFNFEPKQHFEIGEALGMMDFETAARLSGARFVVQKQALARLERALTQFMLDLHTGEHGYTEISPPLMVREEVMFGTAQLPKFEDDQFKTTDDRWLIPTAEVPLTNSGSRADPARRRLAHPRDGRDALLPRRGRGGGPRHARDDPPAPVLQGGARLRHEA